MFGLVPIPLSVEVIVVVPSLLCRGCCVGERSYVLLVCIYQILSGGFLCGRSCVKIVKIFLCEGGDVEQWLESQNISWCLCLDLSLSTLSLSISLSLSLYFALHSLFNSYMLEIICVLLLVFNQESY